MTYWTLRSDFGPGNSCVTALSKITDDIILASDMGSIMVLVLLDFFKAFDKMNHLLLLSTLHYVGSDACGVHHQSPILINVLLVSYF